MGFEAEDVLALLAELPALPDLETAMDALLAQKEAQRQEQKEQRDAAQVRLLMKEEELKEELEDNDPDVASVKETSLIMQQLADGDTWTSSLFSQHCALRASFPTRILNLVGWEDLCDGEEAITALIGLLSSPNMRHLEEVVLSLPRSGLLIFPLMVADDSV
jgi:hypothetical protein